MNPEIQQQHRPAASHPEPVKTHVRSEVDQYDRHVKLVRRTAAIAHALIVAGAVAGCILLLRSNFFPMEALSSAGGALPVFRGLILMALVGIAALLAASVVIIEQDEILARLGGAPDLDRADDEVPELLIQPLAHRRVYALTSPATGERYVAHKSRYWAKYRFFTSWTMTALMDSPGDKRQFSMEFHAPLGRDREAFRDRLVRAFEAARTTKAVLDIRAHAAGSREGNNV